MDWDATRPLARWEKIGLALFAAVLIVFGAYVEMRSAFLSRRMGDLDVFLRAAWAVRSDKDPYAIASDNDWHYLYPPLYAILLTPLADPPRGADASGYLPYPVSVAIVYLVSLACLFAGAHVLASALEEQRLTRDFSRRVSAAAGGRCGFGPSSSACCRSAHTSDARPGQSDRAGDPCARRWPAGFAARNFRAGLWLALAICIKVIPAFLLVYPLWKRDGRGIARLRCRSAHRHCASCRRSSSGRPRR